MTEQHDESANARKQQEEATKKRLADEQKAREKAHAEQRDASTVKPTPTQAENDLAASGVHVMDKEPDGSPPDANLAGTAHSTRQVEAKPAARGAYPTRTVQPQS